MPSEGRAALGKWFPQASESENSCCNLLLLYHSSHWFALLFVNRFRCCYLFILHFNSLLRMYLYYCAQEVVTLTLLFETPKLAIYRSLKQICRIGLELVAQNKDWPAVPELDAIDLQSQTPLRLHKYTKFAYFIPSS